MIPNKKNFCGGNFQDWLEVNLISKCNGKCSWCIEKNGFIPRETIPWESLVTMAISTNKKNIILLGGEPTLHKNIKDIIYMLSIAGRRVYITTNGSKLNKRFILSKFEWLYGINISIHDYDLKQNYKITGIKIKNIKKNISYLHRIGINVRLNCNCIKNHIDTREKIYEYISWAKLINADCVRFSELKNDDENFVNLAKILNYKYGLNDDPFKNGCNNETIINDMRISFRQMCGLQTNQRKKITNPQQYYKKNVLYSDGKIYAGWQTINKEKKMEDKEIKNILESIKKGTITINDALIKLKNINDNEYIIKKQKSVKEFNDCRY